MITGVPFIIKVCLEERTVALQKMSFHCTSYKRRADNSDSVILTDMNFII